MGLSQDETAFLFGVGGNAIVCSLLCVAGFLAPPLLLGIGIFDTVAVGTYFTLRNY